MARFTVQGIEHDKIEGITFKDGFDLIFNYEEKELLKQTKNIDEFYKELSLIIYKIDKRMHKTYIQELMRNKRE